MKAKLKALHFLLASWIVEHREMFDIRDFLVYGGLLCVGYGLYQLFPWLGWTAFGLLSMMLGLGWLFRIRVPK